MFMFQVACLRETPYQTDTVSVYCTTMKFSKLGQKMNRNVYNYIIMNHFKTCQSFGHLTMSLQTCLC